MSPVEGTGVLAGGWLALEPALDGFFEGARVAAGAQPANIRPATSRIAKRSLAFLDAFLLLNLVRFQCTSVCGDILDKFLIKS